MAPDLPVVRTSEAELRSIFNEHYLSRVLNGHFTVKPFGRQGLYQNPADLNGRIPEPAGTISGLIEIIDPATDRRIAIAHRLLRPDQTYGASGLPDPKMVLSDGKIYLQKRKEGRASTDLRTPSLFADASNLSQNSDERINQQNVRRSAFSDFSRFSCRSPDPEDHYSPGSDNLRRFGVSNFFKERYLIEDCQDRVFDNLRNLRLTTFAGGIRLRLGCVPMPRSATIRNRNGRNCLEI